MNLKQAVKTYFLFASAFLFGWAFILMFRELFGCIFVDLTLSRYFFWYLLTRLPLQLPLVIFITTSIKNKWWQKMFSWKIWSLPASAIISFSAISWHLTRSPFKTEITGISWSWIAYISHTALFMLQLFLYQRSRPNLESFILSFLGCYLGSLLYELPVILVLNYPIQKYLYYPLTVAIITFGYLLFYQKLKFSKSAIIVSVLLLAPFYLLYFKIPFWLHRLFVFPLFLSLPLSR